jgi:hypothetical protein
MTDQQIRDQVDMNAEIESMAERLTQTARDPK